MRKILIASVLVACGGGTQVAVEHPIATKAPTASTSVAYSCGDPIAEQATTGTEPVTAWNPCWDIAEEESLRVRANAAAERAEKVDRQRAAQLVQANLVHCTGLPEQELSHSPFAHKRAIAEVLPHRGGGKVHGVRILLKHVPGLSAEYMRKAIACHRARYETLGKPASYLPDDPTLLDGIEVTVTDHRGRIDVMITSDDDEICLVALDRAQQLLRDRTATR